MLRPSLTRRQFASTLGAGLGAALVEGPFGARRAEAGRPSTRPGNTPADAVLLNSNENPYGPAASALDAMTKAEGVAARYPDAAEERLTETIARLHAVTPDRVVLGCGSGEVLQMADMAFLGPGKKVVVAEPTFEAVLAFARVTKAEGVKVPLTADFRHDLPRMAAACDAGTGLVYVCNPNNPTGTIVTRDVRDWLCRELDRDRRRYIPSHANFLMIDVGGDVKPFIDSFRDRHILVGRRFASLPNWLRVSMGTKPEMQAFVDALRVIAPARAA